MDHLGAPIHRESCMKDLPHQFIRELLRMAFRTRGLRGDGMLAELLRLLHPLRDRAGRDAIPSCRSPDAVFLREGRCVTADAGSVGVDRVCHAWNGVSVSKLLNHYAHLDSLVFLGSSPTAGASDFMAYLLGILRYSDNTSGSNNIHIGRLDSPCYIRTRRTGVLPVKNERRE